MSDGSAIAGFLDDLRNLSSVLAVTLGRVRHVRNEFLVKANADEMWLFENFVTRVRTASEHLEKELNFLEYLATTKRNGQMSKGNPPKS